ncbi:hypothetical protein PAPHI01_2298 [Pancytospora philotis]|nr:hypothetical protein PAPHI01_2298 [Pancytospora philotis]
MNMFLTLLLGGLRGAGTSAGQDYIYSYILEVERSFDSNIRVDVTPRFHPQARSLRAASSTNQPLGCARVDSAQWEKVLSDYEVAAHELNSWAYRLYDYVSALRRFSLKRKYGFIFADCSINDTIGFLSKLGARDILRQPIGKWGGFDSEFTNLNETLLADFIAKVNEHFTCCFKACCNFLSLYDSRMYGPHYARRATDVTDKLSELMCGAKTMGLSVRHIAQYSLSSLEYFDIVLRELKGVASRCLLMAPDNTVYDPADPSPRYHGFDYLYQTYKRCVEALILVQKELNALNRHYDFLDKEFDRMLKRECENNGPGALVDYSKLAYYVIKNKLPAIITQTKHTYTRFRNIANYLPSEEPVVSPLMAVSIGVWEAPKPAEAAPHREGSGYVSHRRPKHQQYVHPGPHNNAHPENTNGQYRGTTYYNADPGSMPQQPIMQSGFYHNGFFVTADGQRWVPFNNNVYPGTMPPQPAHYGPDPNGDPANAQCQGL